MFHLGFLTTLFLISLLNSQHKMNNHSKENNHSVSESGKSNMKQRNNSQIFLEWPEWRQTRVLKKIWSEFNLNETNLVSYLDSSNLDAAVTTRVRRKI